MPKNQYQNLIDYQKLRTKNKVEGEQKLNSLGQMSKQAQFKKYISDQAVFWPK